MSKAKTSVKLHPRLVELEKRVSDIGKTYKEMVRHDRAQLEARKAVVHHYDAVDALFSPRHFIEHDGVAPEGDARPTSVLMLDDFTAGVYTLELTGQLTYVLPILVDDAVKMLINEVRATRSRACSSQGIAESDGEFPF